MEAGAGTEAGPYRGATLISFLCEFSQTPQSVHLSPRLAIGPDFHRGHFPRLKPRVETFPTSGVSHSTPSAEAALSAPTLQKLTNSQRDLELGSESVPVPDVAPSVFAPAYFC